MNHNFHFDITSSTLNLNFIGRVTLENAMELMREVVSKDGYPEDIKVLQNYTQANIDASMTEVRVMEAFQRQYIDNFNHVKMAIVLPELSNNAAITMYYKGIICNLNCETKLFEKCENAIEWLNSSTIL